MLWYAVASHRLGDEIPRGRGRRRARARRDGLGEGGLRAVEGGPTEPLAHAGQAVRGDGLGRFAALQPGDNQSAEVLAVAGAPVGLRRRETRANRVDRPQRVDDDLTTQRSRAASITGEREDHPERVNLSHRWPWLWRPP